MTIDRKTIPFFFILIMIFLVSYLWRRNKNSDIERNSKYTFGKITKKLSSLKNGNHWYYEFTYKGKIYEYYRSTHVGYNVKVGDFFLVQFSKNNPEHSKIYYEYQLNPDMLESKSYIGDSIPKSIVLFHEKKDRIW